MPTLLVWATSAMNGGTSRSFLARCRSPHPPRSWNRPENPLRRADAVDPYAGFEPSVGEICALRTFRIGRSGTLCPLFSDTAREDGANLAHCADVPPGG